LQVCYSRLKDSKRAIDMYEAALREEPGHRDAHIWLNNVRKVYDRIGCEKRHFLSHLYTKCIVLPRQARDKHRENSKKTDLFRRDQTNADRSARKGLKICPDNGVETQPFYALPFSDHFEPDHLPRQVRDRN
jgi:hypothetical protein